MTMKNLWKHAMGALLLLAAIVPQRASAQAFDGDMDKKVHAGYLDMEGKSGIEMEFIDGLSDCFSYGGFARVVFNNDVKPVAEFVCGFGFVKCINGFHDANADVVDDLLPNGSVCNAPVIAPEADKASVKHNKAIPGNLLVIAEFCYKGRRRRLIEVDRV